MFLLILFCSLSTLFSVAWYLELKLPSLIKGRPSTTTTNNNNNKAKCIPGGTLRVLAGKKCIGSMS
jgi:hypothetical protein